MRRLLLGTTAVLCGISTGVWGQQTPSSSGTQITGIETVIVTARKRAEDAQQVPIAITALDQASLEKLSVQTVEDLKYVAPSVYIAPTTFRQDTLNVTIRGQRDFDSSSGQSVMSFDTAAAIYVDGVYMARPVGLTGSLFDVDRIEVHCELRLILPCKTGSPNALKHGRGKPKQHRQRVFRGFG